MVQREQVALNIHHERKMTMKQVLTYLTILMLFRIGSFAQEKKDELPPAPPMGQIELKELDQFHELLHPLVHDAYPKKDFATIRTALPSLVKSATLVKNAKLPAELASKSKSYDKQSKKLLQQLTDMDKKKAKMSDKDLGKKFMEMHDTFEELMGLVK